MSDVTVRILHDTSLAVWFGGTVMGAVGLDAAAAQVDDPTDRARVAAAGWQRWQPIGAVAVATHVISGIGITRANRGRIVAQQGVATLGTAKAIITGLALVTEGYAAWLTARVGDAGGAPGGAPGDGAADPSGPVPEEQAARRRRLTTVQRLVPALTGSLVVITAVMGEHQRAIPVARGVLGRLTP